MDTQEGSRQDLPKVQKPILGHPKKKIKINQGDKFGRWKIINELQKDGRPIVNKRYFLCECECGVQRVVRLEDMRTNKSLSCGCLEKELKTKHGLSGTRIFDIWKKMISRCKNKNEQSYKLYGGRGITVCNGWCDPLIFNEWAINNGYRDDLSIERVDNNGNYEPGNCKWIPMVDQARNRRNNRVITFNGKTMILIEWSIYLGIKYPTLKNRLHLGWPIEKAFTTPVKNRGGGKCK